MNEVVLQFIQSQRICVLAVEMLDGSPHAATVHFAHSDGPFLFFFETHRDYRKAEPLFGRESTRASLVIGSNENDMRTLQLDGVVRLLKDDEQEIFEKIYLGKFPTKETKMLDPKAVRFTFIPSWWRYTDWTRPEGKLILNSEDNSQK